MYRRRHIISLALIASFSTMSAHASCGSGVCVINTNWDEHSAGQPGISIDVRYSYSKADQLRSGAAKISADTSNAGEVENLQTINKIINTSIDYTHDEHWGATLNLPYVAREHSHNLGPYNPDGTAAGSEVFSANALGDVKLVGRYRWALNEDDHTSLGIKAGVKLNTGRQDFAMVDNTGASKLPGEVALQPGSGSTDFIVGVFWQQAKPGSDVSWFAQGVSQCAFNNRADFRPGNQLNLDGGVRYAFSSSFSGLLQLNAQWNEADSGTSAALTSTGEHSSGGNSISISPGFSYAILPGSNFYGLVLVPLQQYVNGEQLTANNSVTAGINHRF